jgi:hypothetical protein
VCKVRELSSEDCCSVDNVGVPFASLVMNEVFEVCIDGVHCSGMTNLDRPLLVSFSTSIWVIPCPSGSGITGVELL